MVVSALGLNVTMMPTRVHRASHTSMEWVVRMVQQRLSLVVMREMMRHILRRDTGSMHASAQFVCGCMDVCVCVAQCGQ